MDERAEFFVARDRARRVGWRLEQIRQERRLAWRGDDVGMASVKDDAEEELAAVAADVRRSVEEVVEGRVRDRERGFMEIPFAVALLSVCRWVEEAAALEARRRRRQPGWKEAPQQIDDLLGLALKRLAAFQAAYDAKAPIGTPHAVDVTPLLERTAARGPGAGTGIDESVPLVTVPEALEDLLLAVRDAVPGDGGWKVRGARPGRPLRIERGDVTGEATALPAAVERAAQVLAFRHPVTVTAHGPGRAAKGPAVAGVRVELGDPAGESLATAVELAAGPGARLPPSAARAVHALFSAPPVGPGGQLPPERLVALQRVVESVESETRRVLEAPLAGGTLRWVATNLPREATRKAPPRASLLAALAEALPGAPVERLGDLATRLARGKLAARTCTLAEAALLLLVFGQGGTRGGVTLERGLALPPLAEEDLAALAQDLLDVHRIRGALGGTGEIAPDLPTRLERACVAILGRLGRVEGP